LPSHFRPWTGGAPQLNFFQDDYRLPEGMRRVGYDADTGKYTFVDENHAYYLGESGAEYGVMTAIEPDDSIFREPNDPSKVAPQDELTASRCTDRPRLSVDTEGEPQTFDQILSSIPVSSPTTAAVSPEDMKPHHRRSASMPDPQTARTRFVTAVRKARLPRLQGAVRTLLQRTNSKWRPAEAEEQNSKQSSPTVLGSLDEEEDKKNPYGEHLEDPNTGSKGKELQRSSTAETVEEKEDLETSDAHSEDNISPLRDSLVAIIQQLDKIAPAD
jgi:hypothetical protein